MSDIFDVVLLVSTLTKALLHTISFYLLRHLKRNGHDIHQATYLTNLSRCEIIMSVLLFIRCVSHFTSWSNVRQFHMYIDIVNLGGCGIVYYLSISLITVDRLLDILLNIRYPVYCTEQKTKRILCVVWVLGCAVIITLVVLEKKSRIDTYHLLFTYVYPVCNAAYLLLAVATYVFIFQKFNQTRTDPTGNEAPRRRQGVTAKPTTTERLSLLQVYRNSRFHIPVLIITSFLMFKVTPDLIAEVVGCTNEKFRDMVLHVCLMSYCISGIVSAYVYLQTEPLVMNLRRKKFKELRLWWQCRRKLRWRRTRESSSCSREMDNLPHWQRDIRMQNIENNS